MTPWAKHAFAASGCVVTREIPPRPRKHGTPRRMIAGLCIRASRRIDAAYDVYECQAASGYERRRTPVIV
jgi:hypothetical protein